MTFPGERAEDHHEVNEKRQGYTFWHLTAFGLCCLPLFSPPQRRKKQSQPCANSVCSHREVPQHGGYHSTFSPLCLERSPRTHLCTCSGSSEGSLLQLHPPLFLSPPSCCKARKIDEFILSAAQLQQHGPCTSRRQQKDGGNGTRKPPSE